MEEIFQKLVLYLLTESCYNEFFKKYNFLHVECLKQGLSKGLGYGIILGATLVKVPQIIKIIKVKSSEGISFTGVFLELFAITSNAAYCYANSFPFSAWGESFSLMIETAIIAYLVLFYSDRQTQAHAFVAAYCTAIYFLFSGTIPNVVLWQLQAFNIPIIVAGKMVQALQNYQNGHTGQLSATTVTLLVLGSCARIFTSIQEMGDHLIIFTYVVATAANVVIFAQILYYWEATNRIVVARKLD